MLNKKQTTDYPNFSLLHCIYSAEFHRQHLKKCHVFIQSSGISACCHARRFELTQVCHSKPLGSTSTSLRQCNSQFVPDTEVCKNYSLGVYMHTLRYHGESGLKVDARSLSQNIEG